MKKLLTYTVITTMISCFSYVNPSFADTQVKNDNVIKLDLKENNTFNLALTDKILSENNKSIPNNEYNPFFMNFILPGYTQFYYGDALKGSLFFGGTILAFILPTLLQVATSGNYSNNRNLSIFIDPLLPCIYIWNLLDAGFMAYNKQKSNKVSVKNDNLFNVALLSRDF